MARHPRLDLPNVPQHILQRGNNRGTCFFDDRGRRRYLNLLEETARVARVSVHAFVLMTNHVHLLVTPHESGGVSHLMQAVGRRYVQWLNKSRGRTGTLFEGRFRSSLVQSERYLLCCYRYIELNPVRAGLAADPADYPWSSFRTNALGEPRPMITMHPLFVQLGDTPAERHHRYRQFVAGGLPAHEHEAIRSHVRQGRVLGSRDFQAWIESATGRRALPLRRGRPRKSGPDPIFGG